MSHRFHRDDADTAALDAASRAGGTLADRLNLARRKAEAKITLPDPLPEALPETSNRPVATWVAWALVVALLAANMVAAVLE